MTTTEPKKYHRSGISSDRAYRIQRKMESHLWDIYSQTVMFQRTHEQMSLQVSQQVYSSSNLQKAPAYVHSFLQGMLEVMRSNIYREHLVWALSIDGKLMTSKEVDQLTAQEKKEQDLCGIPFNWEYKSPWSRVDGDKCRHVWKKADGTPAYDRPYDGKFLPIKEG
jgi:hypothetical protein